MPCPGNAGKKEESTSEPGSLVRQVQQKLVVSDTQVEAEDSSHLLQDEGSPKEMSTFTDNKQTEGSA